MLEFVFDQFIARTEFVRDLGNGLREFRLAETLYEGKRVAGIPAHNFLTFRGKAGPDLVNEIARQASEEETADISSLVIEGITSSTSVDFYGTEMSRECLENMAIQFRNGVPITPAHHSWFEIMEWREQMGVSSNAFIERADVERPADESEQGYLLRIEFGLFGSSEDAHLLVKRLGEGQIIGLSIGGWFTEIRFLVDEDDGVERIIIERVLLDHSAITRMPANPDSVGLKLIRSISFASEETNMDEEENDRNAGESEQDQRSVPPPGEEASQPEPFDPVAVFRSMSPEQIEQIRTVLASTEPTNTPAADETEDRATPEPDNTGADPAPETVPSQEGTDEGRSADPEETEVDEQTKALLQAIADGQKALSARMDAIEARGNPAPPPAPTNDPIPEPEEDRSAALEEENRRLRHALNRVQAAGAVRGLARRGFIPASGMPETQLSALVSRAREEGNSSIAGATESYRNILEADRYVSLEKVSRSQLEDALKAFCRAGVEDGIIRDPSTSQVMWS